ncbi:MAG: amidohydrolase family protein [Gemmatimonadota bacterium]|nr:amidohydrolase family protein [Gemmatimonadota bacterium]
MRPAPFVALALLPATLLAQASDTTSAARSPARTVTAYAIRNATIVPVSGPVIQNGSVVIRGAQIEAAGAGVTIPPDATVVDGTGLFVYPGMIDAGTSLGLTEIGSVPGGVDTRELGDFNPQNVSLTAVNPHSELIPVTRVNGVTTVITGPAGGLISGSAALMDLAGWTPAEMGVRQRAGMVIAYPTDAGGFGGLGGFGGFGQQRSAADREAQLNEQVRHLRSYLADARAYVDVKHRLAAGSARTNGAGAQRVSQPMEAMAALVRGEIPAIVDANSAAQIRGALALADSFGIKIILRGAREGWRLADTLAARRIPVIVGPLTAVPGAEDPYDMVYANPGALARAGVKIAFQSSDAANSRNLPYHAALATAYGLDPQEALRALTINAAEIFGVADRYGTIEPGKVANLILTTGDPLDVRTIVRQVFIRGEMVPMTDRHTRLYEQFKARPTPE